MDVLLAIILSCSVHFDDHLVEALAAKMSLNNRFFVGDLSTLSTYDGAHSVAEAHKILDSIIARGGRPAVGLLSVPVAWAARFGRAPDDLFDGCVNVGIATSMLSEYAERCTVGPGRRRSRRRPLPRQRESSPSLRSCILRRLEVDLDMTGVVRHVLPEVAKLDARQNDPDSASSVTGAPLHPASSDTAAREEARDWSDPQLYFSSSPTAPSEMSPPAIQQTPRARGPAPAGARVRSPTTGRAR